jgi:hypothetical protein
MHEAIARDQERMVGGPVHAVSDDEERASSPANVVKVLPMSGQGKPPAENSEPVALDEADPVSGRAPGIASKNNSLLPEAPAQIRAETALKIDPDSTPELQPQTSLASEAKSTPAGVTADAVSRPKPMMEVTASGAKSPAEVRSFSTGQYRICEIRFLDKDSRLTQVFRFGEVFRLQVIYECLLPELPEYSCGLAVAFNRVSDFESVMYFNTNYPHSDDELHSYFRAPFRQYFGKRGVIEAVIDPLQLRAGEYYVSLGILSNQPGPHEFYVYMHCHHRVAILPNGFDEPSVFYPIVSWTNGPL